MQRMKVRFPLWAFALLYDWSAEIEECRELIDYCNSLPDHWFSSSHQEVTYWTKDPTTLLYTFLRCLKYIFGCNELITDCWIITCYGDKEIRVCSRYNAVVLGGKPWLLLTAQVELNFISILFSPGNQILHVECQELNLGTYPVTTRRVCEWVFTSVATSSEFNTDVQRYEDYIYCFSDAE